MEIRSLDADQVQRGIVARIRVVLRRRVVRDRFQDDIGDAGTVDLAVAEHAIVIDRVVRGNVIFAVGLADPALSIPLDDAVEHHPVVTGGGSGDIAGPAADGHGILIGFRRGDLEAVEDEIGRMRRALPGSRRVERAGGPAGRSEGAGVKRGAAIDDISARRSIRSSGAERHSARIGSWRDIDAGAGCCAAARQRIVGVL